MTTTEQPQGRVVDQPLEIHTSDRALFKRCRRRWDLASPIRRNLAPTDADQGALWLGTGVHFALEDYHGYQQFETPARALRAYAQAHVGTPRLPDDAKSLVDLGSEMLTYYANHWLPTRDEFQTLIVAGVPQVEVRFRIQLEDGWTYDGRFDRIVVDPFGRLWIQDYKTAAKFDTDKLDLDDQVSSYSWAGGLLFGDRVEGVLFTQLRKAIPDLPAVIRGGGLSTNKQQATTAPLYRIAMAQQFGSDEHRWPQRQLLFLEWLEEQETPEGDLFIRQDLVRRSQKQNRAQEQKIRWEVEDMLSDHLRLYPHPQNTPGYFGCGMCPFRVVCLSMDDGSDWDGLLEDGYEIQKGRDDSWRSRLATLFGLKKTLDPIVLELDLRGEPQRRLVSGPKPAVERPLTWLEETEKLLST